MSRGGQSHAPRCGTLAAMPPKPGDTIELAIDTLAYGGQGIGRVDGFVVFVRGALPGDVARVEVTRRRSGYAEARLAELITPSARRVPFRCDHPPDAGGCEWQTFDYAAQLEFKHRQVVEALAHIGGLDQVDVGPILGMADPWRYRNKMEYSFGQAGGETVLGMHRRGSWRDIVDVPDCHLAPVEISRARQAVLTACRALRLPPYSQIAHSGLLRHLVVRRGLATGELLLNLFVTERFAEERELAERVAAEQPYTSFAVTVNETRSDAATGVGPFMVVGPPYFHEELAGVRLRVPAMAFLQTNSEMCSLLYEAALRAGRPQAGRRAYDLYCGIGALSLLLARRASQVDGLELQDEAIAAAAENARLDGAANLVFSGRRRAHPAARPAHRPRPRHRPPRGGRRQGAPLTTHTGRAPFRAAGRRGHRPAARRHGQEGRRAHGAARRGAHRVRVVQPDDARRQRRPARRDRLPPGHGHAGRHVPAHPPHRGGGDLSQGGVGESSRAAGVQRFAIRSALAARKASESSGSAGSARE